MTEQEAADQFGMLVVGLKQLPENDPRNSWIQVAQIALQEYIGLTMYADKAGLLEMQPADNGFQPQFVKDEDE